VVGGRSWPRTRSAQTAQKTALGSTRTRPRIGPFDEVRESGNFRTVNGDFSSRTWTLSAMASFAFPASLVEGLNVAKAS